MERNTNANINQATDCWCVAASDSAVLIGVFVKLAAHHVLTLNGDWRVHG